MHTHTVNSRFGQSATVVHQGYGLKVTLMIDLDATSRRNQTMAWGTDGHATSVPRTVGTAVHDDTGSRSIAESALVQGF